METQRISATPTPKKRAFGTSLPTNSPFPRQRQQQQPKSAKKQLQWSDKKQSTSTATTTSEVQNSRRKRSNRTSINDHSRTGNSIVSTPYNTKTPTNVIREGTPSVKWSIPESTTRSTLRRSSKKQTTPGRVNLFNDFNSPLVPSNVATPGVVRQFDTSTQKLTYAKIAASSPKHGTPESSPAAADQSFSPTTPPISELFSSNNTSPSAESISPSSASSVKSNSTTGTSLAVNATSTDVPETIAPSEYVIEFPPGPLHLKFDSVVYTLGKPMGCCIAQILPEFDSDLTCVRMANAGEKTNAEAAAATVIQVNDLIVSINGTNVLSRKFDVITDLLQKLDGSHKTIVFRSIEKVWTSQFQRKTMRNLRSGKRVATALSDGQMGHSLHSWVETPTKVEVGRRGDRRSGASGDKLESITEALTSNEAQTPRGDTASRASMDLFSPSNVKKVVSQRSSDVELVLSTTPKVSRRDEVAVSTEKENSITSIDKKQGSNTNASKQSPINQISKAIVGGNSSEHEFERSLRLKKNVLKELNGVCLELGERYFSDEAAPESEDSKEDILVATTQVPSKDVSEEVRLLEDRVRELTNALATAEDEAREREDDLEDQLQQLQLQLSSKSDDTSHEEEVRRLKEEKEQAVKEVEQKLEKERAHFQERVAKGKISKQELISKLGATQSELEKNKALCAELEKKAMSKKEMKAKLKSSSTLIQSLTAEKGHLAKEVKVLLQKLSERDDSEKEKQAELEEKTSELQKMMEQVANLESERDTTNKEKQDELDALSLSLTEKAAELEKMVEEVTNLKHHLSLSEKKGSADRVALKANKSKLVEECEQLKTQLAASDKAKDDLHAKIDEHEIELSRRQTLLNELKSRNYSLQEMIDELNETLEKSGNDSSEQVEFLERKLQTMKEELDESKSSNIQHEEETRRLVEENLAMQKQLVKANGELEENRRSLLEKDKLSSENEFLDNKVGVLTESLAKAENDAKEREGFLEKKLEIVKMELEETRCASNMRQDEILRLKKEKHNILEDADSKYDDFREQLSAKEEELKAVSKKAEEVHLCLKEELEKEKASKMGLLQKLEATKTEHTASLSRRQELLDDMEKHNALLKQRVSELTDCLATSEDDAREREDILNEKLKQVEAEFREAKMTYNRQCISQMEALKRVGAEKEAALQDMCEKMNAERVSCNERVAREERSKADVMAELDSIGKHNDLLKQRVAELTDCLATAEDDAREREDALEEKLKQIGVEFEGAKMAYDKKLSSQMEDLKRVEVEKDAELHNVREQMKIELLSLKQLVEREELSKTEVMAELDATKDQLIDSEASNADLECRLEDVRKAMDTKICELNTALQKAQDDAREQEDALQEELCLLGKKVDESKLTASRKDEDHKLELQRIEEGKRTLLNENTKLQEQLECLMSQIELGENTKNDLQGRVDALDKAKAFHEKSLSRRQELLDDMEARNTFLKQRVDELVDCLAKAEDDAREREDALNDKLLQIGAEFEAAKLTLNKEHVAHTEEARRFEEEKKDLASQISSLGDEMDDLMGQISVLKCSNSDLETELCQIKESYAESNEQVNELSEKLSEVNQDVLRSKALCTDLKSKLETAERLLDESDAEISTLSYDCDCLEKQVESLNAQLDSHQKAISDYESQMSSLQNEIALIRDDNESLREDLESQMAKVLLSEDDKSDLVVKIDSLAAALKTAEAEKLKLSSERDSIKSTSDERLALLQQLEGKTEIRQSELLDSLTAKEFEISSLTSQREELECSLDDLDCRLKQLQNQYKKESESFKNREDQLLNEISTVNAKNEAYLTQMRSLEANIGRVTAELKNEKETHEKTERQLLIDIRNSQNSISGAKLKHTHAESELQSVKFQLSTKVAEISKLADEKESLETELRKAKAEASAKAHEHDITVKKLESDVEKERALCVDLTSRVATLTSDVNAKQEEVHNLKQELSCANESMRLVQLKENTSKSTLESQLNDIRSQFEAERQSLQGNVSQLEADALELQQNLLTEQKSSIEIEAHLSSQVELIRAELSNAKRMEDDLREQLSDMNTLLKEKNYEIEELNSDIMSEKDDRRQELFEMKCLYEKKIQETTTASLDIEAEKSSLVAKVERLTQDISAAREKESANATRTAELEQLLQSQNEELLKISDDMSSTKVSHENTLSEMEKNYTRDIEELTELHDAERSDLLKQMSEISDELQQCQEKLREQMATQEDDKALLENDKDMIDQLRTQLEEGINLNESLSMNLKGKDRTIEVLRRDLKLKEERLIAADMQYKAKIEEMKSSHAAEKQNLADEVERFSTELDWSLDQIDKRQSIIDSQRLSLNDENNELIRELSKANETEIILRKMLHGTHMEVQQLSIEYAAARSEIVMAISEARSSSEESLQQTADMFKATAAKWSTEKISYEDKIKALSEDVHKLSKRDEHLSSQVDELQASLELREQTVEELSSKLSAIKDCLRKANFETDRSKDLASRVDELQRTLESRDQHINDLSSQLTSEKKDLCAAHEETQRVRDNLECVLNQLDEMVETNEDLQEEICKLENAQQESQSLHEAEKSNLQSRIDILLSDRCDKLESVTSELDATLLANEKLRRDLDKLESQKNECQRKFEADKEALQSKIDSLVEDLSATQDELREAKATVARIEQDCDTNVQTALSDLDDMQLKNELLNDEITNLKVDLKACHQSFDTQRETYESKIVSLSTELKSSTEQFEVERESFKSEWRHFQVLLKHLVDSIEGKVDAVETKCNSDAKELPDIASQLGTLIELVGKKEESILQLKSQIESLEFDLSDARIVRDRLLHHDHKMEDKTAPEQDLETSRFLSEIEEAKVKVIGMDKRMMSERNKRKELEVQLLADRKSLATLKEELAVRESTIDELEETVQLKIGEIVRLESQLCKNDDFREKLEGKYEQVKSEIESHCNLATELKQTIIQKNQDIESKEGRIMELQFQIDDLESQVEGWKASLQGLTCEADGWKTELQNMKHDFQDDEFPNDTSELMSSSFDRHDELSKEILRLEEKMLEMDEEHRQQSSMHKSIVDGLEARCNALSEDNAEAKSYVSSLEDSKVHLQSKIDMLKKDSDIQCRRLSELESVFALMKHQKTVSETLCDEVLSGLRKLTEIVIMYSSRLDGFSEELSSPSSWSVNLEYISRVIEFALQLNQKYALDIQRLETTIDIQKNGNMPVAADAITPRAKGSGVRNQEKTIMPEHLDMIDEIKNMKDVIKNVMASPKLTPSKGVQRTSTNDDDDGDVYSDLLMAHDQLESLSKKIETYQKEQIQWKEKESTLQSRIDKLEEEKVHESSSKATVDQSSANVENKTSPETPNLHLSIVKDMARELNSTREKVQLLKTNLGMDTRQNK